MFGKSTAFCKERATISKTVGTWYINFVIYVKYTRKRVFSDRVFPYKDERLDSDFILENTGQRKSKRLDQKRKLFCTNNSFVLAHSSAKKKSKN